MLINRWHSKVVDFQFCEEVAKNSNGKVEYLLGEEDSDDSTIDKVLRQLQRSVSPNFTGTFLTSS